MYLGIHLDSSLLHACRIDKAGKIKSLHNVKPLYMKDLIASVLSGGEILIRPLAAGRAKGRHAEKAALFQAEASLYIKPEEMITLPLLGRKLWVSASKKALGCHLETMQQMGIDPDRVTATPFALSAFIRSKFPEEEIFAIDIRSKETVCVFVVKGELQKAHAIPIGTDHLLESFFEDRKKVLLKKEAEIAARQCDLLIARPSKLHALFQGLQQEIAKSGYSFFGDKKVARAVTGRVEVFLHLAKALGEDKELTLEEKQFAIAIGASLEAKEGVQLRQKEFFPQKNWKRLGICACFTLIAACSLSIAACGLYAFLGHTQEQKMLEITGGEAPWKWISSVEKNRRDYPYILSVPLVSQVISSIAEERGLDVKELRYQLLQLPTCEAPKDPYVAKVEMEFSCPNAMEARRFHEALRQGATYADPDQEIGWDMVQDNYRISFFLKQGAPHVF